MTILSGIAGALGHKHLCIWTGCAAFCLVGVAGAFWLQDKEFKKGDSSPTPSPTPIVEPTPIPATTPVDKSINITSENQSGGFTGSNQGTVNLGGPNPPTPTP